LLTCILTFLQQAAPQPGFLDDIKGLGDNFEDLGNDIGKAFEGGFDDLKKEFNDATGKAEEWIASVTSVAGAEASKLSEFISTATGTEFESARASASSALNKLTQEVDSFTAYAATHSHGDHDGAAPRPTAVVAMGALLGGAAVLAANL
jgi:hypothetical protein